MISPTDIENWFSYHPPANEQVAHKHEAVRRECGHLAHFLNNHVPEGGERDMAVQYVRKAMWAANAGIACAKDPQ